MPSATVEGIEYYEDRKLDKAQILRFATCKYIDEGHHIILKGASGNGKTYIACALGNAACRRFKKVHYIRMPELLDELSIARSSGTLKKMLESYKKKDLLILDEWLIRPLSPQESYDLLEIVEARCQKSMIFCTQYESEGWYTRIDPNPESDSPVSEAIMDRIIHNAYEVLVDGKVSMRERKGLKAAKEERNAIFCTPDFDGVAALFCSGNGLKPLFFPDYHCSLFHVFLIYGVSQRGRVFLGVVSKIHAHYME